MIISVSALLLIGTVVAGLDEQKIDVSDILGVRLNPDLYLDTAHLISRHGYASETHTVQTEDGYLLGIHRIPGSRNGKRGGTPVLMQHGLLGSSSDFVINGDYSLAFALADEGFDVWLGNCRGNTYSRAHVSIPTESPQFWNWSWHEAALFDLPAVLYHISNTTGKTGETVYIGHSMGTTEYFVMASTNQQVAKNVKLMIALAPVAHMAHVKSSLRNLAEFVNRIGLNDPNQDMAEFMPHWKLFDILAYTCSNDILKGLCESLYFALWRWNKDTFNLDILPLTLSHAPSGSSTKALHHYLQIIQSNGTFRQFDYGTIGNLMRYKSPIPPAYELQNIETPIYLMYSDGDSFASSADVERLSKELKTLKKSYKVPNKSFDHIDFVWGKDAYKLVYESVLDILKNSTANK